MTNVCYRGVGMRSLINMQWLLWSCCLSTITRQNVMCYKIGQPFGYIKSIHWQLPGYTSVLYFIVNRLFGKLNLHHVEALEGF